MTVLLDTNVLIDAAVVSRSYHGTAVRLIAAAERDTIDGLVAPTSIATCWTPIRAHSSTFWQT
jgi:predicted nucleic acid-binding protein